MLSTSKWFLKTNQHTKKKITTAPWATGTSQQNWLKLMLTTRPGWVISASSDSCKRAAWKHSLKTPRPSRQKISLARFSFPTFRVRLFRLTLFLWRRLYEFRLQTGRFAVLKYIPPFNVSIPMIGDVKSRTDVLLYSINIPGKKPASRELIRAGK